MIGIQFMYVGKEFTGINTVKKLNDWKNPIPRIGDIITLNNNTGKVDNIQYDITNSPNNITYYIIIVPQ
jgi:hypothetical protein